MQKNEETVINWKLVTNENATNEIYNQLRQKVSDIKLQKEKDLKIKFSGEELDDELEYLDDEFRTNLEKLDSINDLSGLEIIPRKKYIRMLAKIDSLDSINEFFKITGMLSYGVITNMFNIENISEDLAILLSISTIDIDIEDYPYFISILIDQEISDLVIINDIDLPKQYNIIHQVMNELFDYQEFAGEENHNQLVEIAVKSITDYFNKEKNDNKKGLN